MVNPFYLLKIVRSSVLNRHTGRSFNELYGPYDLIDLQSTANERMTLVTSTINLIPKHF